VQIPEFMMSKYILEFRVQFFYNMKNHGKRILFKGSKKFNYTALFVLD